MEITGNTDVLLRLFETAATAVCTGRPETIAEAIEAYHIFWNNRCQTKFADRRILEGLSGLRTEWLAFLGREPNANPENIADISASVTEIHKAIEDALKGKRSQSDFDDLINKLSIAATAVAVKRWQGMESLAEDFAMKFKPDFQNPKQGARQSITLPLLSKLHDTVIAYYAEGNVKQGLFKDETFLSTLERFSRVHTPGLEVLSCDADEITQLWLDTRRTTIEYINAFEQDDLLDDFRSGFENGEHTLFFSPFETPDRKSVLINESLAKEFGFIANNCRKKDLQFRLRCNNNRDRNQLIEKHANGMIESPLSNIKYQNKLYCERFKVSKDFDYIYDTVHKSDDYPQIQNLAKTGEEVKKILKQLFAAYGRKSTGGWVYSGGGKWCPHFGKKPYSTFKNQQIAVRRNPKTNKSEWRIIPLAEFDEESPIGLRSKRKIHSNSKNIF